MIIMSTSDELHVLRTYRTVPSTCTARQVSVTRHSSQELRTSRRPEVEVFRVSGTDYMYTRAPAAQEEGPIKKVQGDDWETDVFDSFVLSARSSTHGSACQCGPVSTCTDLSTFHMAGGGGGTATPQLELLYQASKDGSTAANFHAKCDN